jgi:hypothetical protein
MRAATLTAFRLSDLDIRDPHLFANVPFGGCRDVTDGTFFGQPLINPRLQTSIQTDGMDADSYLDLSFAIVFNPLLQTAGTSTPGYLDSPDCTGPYMTPTCVLPAGAMKTTATAMNMGGGATCLAPVAGTTGSMSPTGTYSPAITLPTAPAGGTCFLANAGTVSFVLSGITINLQNASIGGVYVGAPATTISNGLLAGFLTEADANATIVPAGTTGLSDVDGMPVSHLLRGGTGNCSRPAPGRGDVDILADGTRGWYFYLNFTAVLATYSEL